MYNIEHDFVLLDMNIEEPHPPVLIHSDPSFLRALSNLLASLFSHLARSTSTLSSICFCKFLQELLLVLTVGLRLSFDSPGATEPDAVGSSTELGNSPLREICGVICCGFRDEFESIEVLVF